MYIQLFRRDRALTNITIVCLSAYSADIPF